MICAGEAFCVELTIVVLFDLNILNSKTGKIMPNSKRYTLYITHGGIPPIKGLVRKFNPEYLRWVVVYDASKLSYQFHSLTTAKAYNQDRELIDLSLLHFTSCDELINFISSHVDEIYSVAMDANLSVVAGTSLSQAAHDIVSLTKCEEALFFTDTPLALEDTQKYLDRCHSEHEPPVTLKRARVCTRAQFREPLVLTQIDHPELSFDEGHKIVERPLKSKHQASRHASFFECVPREYCHVTKPSSCCYSLFSRRNRVLSDVKEFSLDETVRASVTVSREPTVSLGDNERVLKPEECSSSFKF